MSKTNASFQSFNLHWRLVRVGTLLVLEGFFSSVVHLSWNETNDPTLSCKFDLWLFGYFYVHFSHIALNVLFLERIWYTDGGLKYDRNHILSSWFVGTAIIFHKLKKNNSRLIKSINYFKTKLPEARLT